MAENSDPKLIQVVRPFVETGFAIQWLKPRTKKPYGEGWAKKPVATIDDLISSHNPKNNVSVRPGRYSQIDDETYLHIIDLDIRKESEENAAWSALRKHIPNIDDYAVAIVQSGSGGPSRHVYLLCDRPFRSKKLTHSGVKYTDDRGQQHWTWEVELFGTGKQAAMPPSVQR